MEQIISSWKHSVSLKVVVTLTLVGAALALPLSPSAARRQATYERGDVFIGLENGQVQRRSPAGGTLLQTLDTQTGGFATGMTFDGAGNLYVTAFGGQRVVRFDNQGALLGNFGSGYSGSPESIITLRDGGNEFFFVGSVDGDNDIRRFDASGAPLNRYNVATEVRGSDWIDLAADRCTMFYTSEGQRILRYNVCTDAQLSDFTSSLPNPNAFALRLLPGGGLIVANRNEVLRLDAAGSVAQRYDAPGEDFWFAANLDPDGTSFWSADIVTGNIYRFDLASGTQLTRIQTGRRIGGIAIFGEITVVNPTPTPTATVSPTATPTPTPSGAADLSVVSSTSATVVNHSDIVTYRLSITNNGPGIAGNVLASIVLPANTTFIGCSADSGGVCNGSEGTRTVRFPTLGPGVTASIEISVQVNCLNVENATLTFTATVRADNFDPITDNNTAVVQVTAQPPRARLSLEGGGAAFSFNPVMLQRDPRANPPSFVFSLENTGCLPLLVGFEVNRTGADTTNGKITNTTDNSTFPVFLINADGTRTLIPSGTQVTIFGGTRRDFRLAFDPKIPTVAGRIAGLSASQAIPELITSLLRITTNAPDLVGGAGLNNRLQTQVFLVQLTGRVTEEIKLINPTAPSLAPLVVLAKNGDEFQVEFSTHDANGDIYCATYQFLDAGDLPIGDAPVFYLDQDIARANLVRGQSFTIVKKFNGANSRPQIRKVRVTVHDRLFNQNTISGVLGSQAGRIVNASAASFSTEALTAESITTAFGQNLAAAVSTANPNAPLPTELMGTQVSVTDAAGVERRALLFFVAPGQVNYLIPRGTPVGDAVVTIVNRDGGVSTGAVRIVATSPAFFTANADGRGVPAATILRVTANGAQTYESVARFDAAQNRFVAVPIDVSRNNEQVYLVIFGSGIRHRSPVAPRAVVAGIDVPVLYAGPQGALVGVDQVNLQLPRTLAGRGEVEISLVVDGRTANPVRIQMR